MLEFAGRPDFWYLWDACNPGDLPIQASRKRSFMSDKDTIRQRTLEAAHLQAIEGNPLDAEQLAMFEMFDREGWSPERQRAYILERARSAAAQQAAE